MPESPLNGPTLAIRDFKLADVEHGRLVTCAAAAVIPFSTTGGGNCPRNSVAPAQRHLDRRQLAVDAGPLQERLEVPGQA